MNEKETENIVGGNKKVLEFDEILKVVGDNGRFQKRFNYTFNIGLVVFASMIYYNIILALSVPEHWCHVPGREYTNYTTDEWKHLTLPSEIDKTGRSSHSRCSMFNVTFSESLQDYYNASEMNTIGCIHGYEYDKTWFQSTIITEYNWVCDKVLYKPNAFVFDRIGEVIGTFIFGQLGDTLGRRIVYNVGIVALLSGRIVQIFTGSVYPMFLAAAVSGSLLANSVFQAPLIISLEISNAENRASNSMMQGLSRSAGMCIMPLVFWALKDWQSFMWVTSLPIALFLCFPKYMIESPRWLATNDKWDESAVCLNRIADINGMGAGAKITGDYLKRTLPPRSSESVYGMASFFTGWRLAINTTLLVMSWITCSVGYFILILYIAQLPGNPFLNFFWQSFVEIPSFFVARYFCNTFGRRATAVVSFALCAALCAATTQFSKHPEWEVYTISLTIIIKMCTSVTISTVYLQSMETYPTCLRQTGMSLGMILCNLIGIAGPYVVYLGTDFDPRYPYAILCVMFLTGAICGCFLPETLHQRLPDTLEEARNFGANQKFWSLPKADVVEQRCEDESEDVQLNPTKHVP